MLLPTSLTPARALLKKTASSAAPMPMATVPTFMIRAGSDQIEISYTLQRATDTTVLPPEGTTFTHDYDRSGTASTLVVKDVTVARDKDSFDTFEMTAVLVTYQA
jgi:hypothetical protein